jgi:integrase/recombinase XerD
MLLSKLKFSPNTVIQRLGASRFFYIKALKKNRSVAETSYPRKVIRLSQILSPGGHSTDRRGRQYVSSRHVDDPLCHESTPRRGGSLRVLDVNSRRMIVHIHGGKNNLTVT